ncbi:hypothetical protein DM02DRAFT_510118 [Periconia macrospinosa]|uniref:ubiquitinyl hydrolase 1 n=1 Tax=Periconia macrospinosa TaxID=97972 RepID=A0A2V1EDU8_9PLEO|nr:hypothetical protein DM02DRAFT_510118 [Periconia macrospinosa]
MESPWGTALLEEQYHHVALPRNVPGRESKNLFAIEAALFERLIAAVKILTPLVPLGHQTAVDAVRLSLVTAKTLNVEGKIDSTLLVKSLGEVASNQALILHVTEQNAALFVYKLAGYVSRSPQRLMVLTQPSSSDIVFEAFETSATSEEVCAAPGALQWDFPGQAVSLPRAVYMDQTFQDSLARFLEQGSIESVKQFSAVTYKAASPMPEVRDTTDPALITGLLMAILRALGQDHPTHTLRKRVRDSVSFLQAHKPWRRSPFYLVLRVAIQRHLCQLLGPDIARVYFKVIMCLQISQLMEETLDHMPHEDTYFLKQKLGRRLAKLESECHSTPGPSNDICSSLFRKLHSKFDKVFSDTSNHLVDQWKSFKTRTQRIVRTLPSHATNADMMVRLPVSGHHLSQLLSGAFNVYHTALYSPLELIHQHEQTIVNAKPIRSEIDRCIAVASFEETKVKPAMAFTSTDPEASCRSLSQTIQSYIEEVAGAFNGYSELKSMFILNVMELWVLMDREAVKCYPLLELYQPGFDPSILDALELLSLDDMARVQLVQDYLKQRSLRWAGRSAKTIFESPADDTFAVTYFDTSLELQHLHSRIKNEAAIARDRKEEEWRELSTEHERLMRLIAESTCAYYTYVTPEGAIIKEHMKGCQKHRYKWEAKQVRIKIFENPLPDSEVAAKTAVFELQCPETFAAYRDATWLILATFAFRSSEALENVPLLSEYTPLRRYAVSMDHKITLGSSTKSHLDCHYAETGFPVALHHVCRPCGLSLDYFDQNNRTWTKRHEVASFAWHFPLHLPLDSPYRALQVLDADWPSSNAIVASQTKCPPDLNIHEFMAWQGLLSGTHSRWLCLLREMGATNLNFSSESTWVIVVKVLLQVGPSHTNTVLRDIHSVFEDPTFCSKLMEQVKYRLEALRCNWREQLQMEILISILLKVSFLCPVTALRDTAAALLAQCREVTWKWCGLLGSAQNDGSNESALYAVWAALLCKQTFHGIQNLGCELQSQSPALRCFIGASIVIQENLNGDPRQMAHSLRSLVLKDAIYTFANRSIIQQAIIASQSIFLSCLNDVWPVPTDSLVQTPSVETLSGGWWMQVSMRSRRCNNTDFLHYDILHGDLLINGKQAGTLPAQYRQNPIVKTMLGTQNLRVLPSFEPGMSLYIRRQMPSGHRVHLGLREGKIVIRATKNGETLELINPQYFSNKDQADLPAPLIDNCWHWLNLHSGIMEIRQDSIWKSKPSNWQLNLRTRSVSRRAAMLVDPQSPLAIIVAQNFYLFEHARNIVVYQPKPHLRTSGPRLAVELKRLDLNFYVNEKGLLQCRQLKSEIVPSYMQDVGVWYGLKSKVALRSVENPSQRSILVPTGPYRCKKDAEHVIITIDNDGKYYKYDINDVLGRVECPAEPRLLYTKALWHACTSFFLPDPLTGRTGKEEALQLLESGLCMPWTYLSTPIMEVLMNIAKLTPARVYYPPTLKSMESVFWNPNLTITIQDDRYRALVERICDRSENMRLFETDLHAYNPPPCPRGNPHLERRAVARSDLASPPHTLRIYHARHGPQRNDGCANVDQISRFLADWSSEIPATPDLAAALQRYALIGGYLGEFQRVQLFDFITADAGENWGTLVYSAIHARPEDRYRLMFVFAPMAFSAMADMELLRTLVSYAVLPDLKAIPYPKFASYVGFQPGEVISVENMMKLMEPALVPYTPIPQTGNEAKQKGQLALRRLGHQSDSRDACKNLALSIRSLWPLTELRFEDLPDVDEGLVDKEYALEMILPEYTRLAQNHAFSEYLVAVQAVLQRHDAKRTLDGSVYVEQPESQLPALLPPYLRPSLDQHAIPTLEGLLAVSVTRMSGLLPDQYQPVNVLSEITNQNATDSLKLEIKAEWIKSPISTGHKENATPDSDTKALLEIVQELRKSASPIQDIYAFELEQSIASLIKLKSEPRPQLEAFNAMQLQKEIREAETKMNIMFLRICQALEKNDRGTLWLKHADLWPRTTKLLLLSHLNSNLGRNFGENVKDMLITFGIQITALQRLRRIEDAALKSKSQQLEDERNNPGHSNWLPMDRPDWLLLEIDSNLMLRDEQVEVANATIKPSSGKNSVVQLLMGKGKTSCILPMVAAVLADKNNLLRIIVPRPLLLQSSQVLQIKLGSLLNREIMHIPFSRKTPTETQLMERYFTMHMNLRRAGGVLVALPEHLLSYKLSGMQRLCDNRPEEGTKMIKFQDWLDRYARDVLDECDVSLAIRTQLIYPSGSQIPVDGHPLRWQSIQAILRLVQLYLPVLERQFPKSIEIVRRPQGGFPLIYLLREDVQAYLVGRLVQDICNGQVSFLPCNEIPPSGQKDIQVFISSAVVAAPVYRRIKEIFKGKDHLLKVLYHLRGLFVHRILLSSLKKRWNVQYGLHPNREPIAVPYHAKGVPSPSSEWGHPDVAIILTCLSFYYHGLSLNQFKQSFEQLQKSDEPSIEYEKWTTKNLPESLRDFNSINVEDATQLVDLYQHMRLNVFLLDFYLNNFVFPKHAKQFAVKLQASGWDLILTDPTSASKCRTTGFSGTNDSRHQLPMTIEQNDELKKLSHTNAEVLSYLLADRNRRYIVAVGEDGRRLGETELLDRLKEERIRILIDAGAQILEHSNADLATAWLTIDHEASAAVYFDSAHRPWVRYRKGQAMPLVASPFAENLEDCVVYLDESHCRGTDLKLPTRARAALTIGPHVTKDALAQAAMRLRLLGQSQAVTFFAPPEVHQGILDLSHMHRGDTREVDSRDVIAWLLRQSCDAIEQLEPLYCTQGNTYLQHVQAKVDNPRYLEVAQQRMRYLSVMQSKEIQTLKELYEPKRLHRGFSTSTTALISPLGKLAKQLERRKQNFQDRGSAVHASALEEVEQEREVEHEVESVREVQKPVYFTPLKVPGLHKDIVAFLKTGKVEADSEAYQSIFSALSKTAVGSKYKGSFGLSSVAPMLFVSTQYTRTVKVVQANDNFVRPCHWLLLSRVTGQALALSPEEADAVLPTLRQARQSRTHLIVYSAPVIRRMLHFNNLDYHATPRLPTDFVVSNQLKVELGIFAGRLYFDWSEYEDLCSCLGIARTIEDQSAGHSSFTSEPLLFLHNWLAALRKGQDFEHTPMGFLTTGKPLSEDHPFFQITEDDEFKVPVPATVTGGPSHVDDEESEDDEHDDDAIFEQNNVTLPQTLAEDKESDFDEEHNNFFDAEEEHVNGIEEDGSGSDDTDE